MNGGDKCNASLYQQVELLGSSSDLLLKVESCTKYRVTLRGGVASIHPPQSTTDILYAVNTRRWHVVCVFANELVFCILFVYFVILLVFLFCSGIIHKE